MIGVRGVSGILFLIAFMSVSRLSIGMLEGISLRRSSSEEEELVMELLLELPLLLISEEK